MSTQKIIDKFTDLSVSRQRKWQLRHPKESKIIWKRYVKSPKGKAHIKKYMREYYKRKLSCKST